MYCEFRKDLNLSRKTKHHTFSAIYRIWICSIQELKYTVERYFIFEPCDERKVSWSNGISKNAWTRNITGKVF